ncbi:MAG: SRPBCC family protein [Bacteroidota bacterium]
MKYLKYLLGLIGLLALLFFGRGLMTPNVSYGSEITVDKPLAEAWAVANDESKTTEWLQGLTNVEHVSGEKGAVGAVTQYTFSQDGQESIILETLKEIRPNEHVAMDFLMEGVMAMDYQMDFSEADGKTTIKSSTVAEGLGMFMRSMFAWTKGSMIAQEDENMGNLKALIEANTTDYFPAPEPVVEAAEAVGEAMMEAAAEGSE